MATPPRPRGHDEPEMFPATPTFSVVELTEAISLAMRHVFPTSVWVQGEIRDLKKSKAGHVYFQLVEPGQLGRTVQASMSVTLFNKTRLEVNNKLGGARGIKMTDGTEIRIRAHIDFYAPQGRLQLRMTDIDPAFTLGRLAEDKEQLLADLAADGLIERNRSQPLHPAPLKVGLVTSADSAADHDFREELASSHIGWRIVLVHTTVQGQPAPFSIAAGIRTAVANGVDIVAVVRGGGAKTDLATFDHETVARAIATCPVPVWTGIGHEIDESIADRVAHSSFKTPTACAAALVKRVEQHHDQCEEAYALIRAHADRRLDDAESAVAEVAAVLERETHVALRVATERLTTIIDRVANSAERVLRDADNRLDLHTVRLEALDPVRTMARGWSITRTSDGSVLRTIDQAQPGDVLTTTLATGSVTSTVEATHGGAQDNDHSEDHERAERQ